MRIIPAIDIINGKCVRLSKGDYSTQKIYNENPLEVAQQFEDAGIEYLHLVDLDGAKAKEIKNIKILEVIASKTSLKIDFGGGVTNENDIQNLLNAGAKQVTLGSLAAQKPELFVIFLEKFGLEKIILGADCHHRKIATNAWESSTDIDVLDFIKDYENKGVQYSVVTDVAKDGMLQGPSLELYTEIIQQTHIKLIASGGISTIDDVIALKQLGCEGAIIGKAIYENRISLEDLKLVGNW